MLEKRLILQAGVIGEPRMKSNAASESRPRAPAFRFQGDGVASINMLSIGALSDFFDTGGPVDG
jgi:hypothetical protein